MTATFWAYIKQVSRRADLLKIHDLEMLQHKVQFGCDISVAIYELGIPLSLKYNKIVADMLIQNAGNIAMITTVKGEITEVKDPQTLSQVRKAV